MREKANLFSRESFGGDRQHTLDLRGLGRHFERDKVKEAADGGQSKLRLRAPIPRLVCKSSRNAPIKLVSTEGGGLRWVARAG
jgi:hypothetical protein